MSERPSSHGIPESSASKEPSRVVQPSLSSTPAIGLQSTVSASHVEQRSQPQTTVFGRPRGLELPPISGTNTSRAETFSPSATRIAGVSSILNPPQEGEAQTGQRRKASQLESPTSSAQQLPPLAPIVRGASSPFTASVSISGHQQAPSPRPARRILTPRSPSGLHRAVSLGQLNPQAGVINAQQVPFPPSPRSRVYTIEPGASGAPPLPTPPARATQTGYGFPAPPYPRESRRASTGTNRARNLSSSASPSTSYSSYSQIEQTSPVGSYAAASTAPLTAAYETNAEGGQGDQWAASDAAASDTQRQMSIPISSSGGPNVYQMMTLETTSGTVQLPVDVQAASRVADEKRRRNAGASARFRQRRKEKEKEASTSIARLEQQVKELAEDADFYRNDRANLLSVLQGIPGMERHLQRPPSPRQMRSGISSVPTSVMSSRRTSYMRQPASEPQSPETGRNVRRRNSTFSLPPPAQLPPPPGPPLQPNYPPGGYPTRIAPQTPGGPLPSPLARQPPPDPMQRQQQVPPLGPPPVMQAHPQTGPYNPYDRKYSEPGPRDGR